MNFRFAAVFASAAALCFASPAARGEDKKEEKDKPASCTPAQKDPDRHERFMKDRDEALKKGNIDLVFIGDSITDAWRGGEPNKIYNERWGKHNPLNLGISGDKTEHVLWRLENGELDGVKPKLVVIMIGTNNLGNAPQATPEDTAAGVKCVVKTVREKVPDAKVLLLGVFPRGREANDKYRGQIKTVNDTIAKLDDGKTVKYLDIGAKFLDAGGKLPEDIMPDALHPSPKGYQIWADAIGPVIDEMMK
jgi:beta-glucosidase